MNNQRKNKFGGPGPRQDRRAQRREEAVARNEVWAGMTVRERQLALDGRLGKDIGAKKQRAKLAKAAA